MNMSGQLEAAKQEIGRLSLLAGVPSRPLAASPLTPPAIQFTELQAMHTPPERPQSSPAASRASSVISFPSYDQQSSLSSADTEVMLPPAAAEINSNVNQPYAKQQEVFSSKELSSLACTCEKDAVGGWDKTFLGRLRAKCAQAYTVLMYSDAEWDALPAAARAVAGGYDSVLAGHILATLQADTPAVKLRRSIIASREAATPGKITGSGRALRGIVLEIISPTCGAELESLEEDLEKPFFNIGMNDTSVRLAAHRLAALRAQLPPTARGGERELLRALLKKFPPELAKKALKYKAEMCKAEVCKKNYEWNYEELTALLASHIASVRPKAESFSTDVARGGGDSALFTTKFKGCLHCGLDGHGTRECTEPPCGYCGLRFCFGVRKKGAARSCLVKRLVGGGKINDSDVGFNGRPLPPQLIEQMQDKAAKLKKAAAGSESNTTEVQTEPNVLGDYDEELLEAEGDSD